WSVGNKMDGFIVDTDARPSDANVITFVACRAEFNGRNGFYNTGAHNILYLNPSSVANAGSDFVVGTGGGMWVSPNGQTFRFLRGATGCILILSGEPPTLDPAIPPPDNKVIRV